MSIDHLAEPFISTELVTPIRSDRYKGKKLRSSTFLEPLHDPARFENYDKTKPEITMGGFIYHERETRDMCFINF
jgi:hypothetical protein